MKLVGVYVDDDPKDQSYAELLSSKESDGVTFECVSDLKDLIELRDIILKLNPSVIALDYRLDENRGKHSGNTDYKGGALAQSIREKQDENNELSCPIILVSNESKIRDFFKPEKTTHDLFDDYYSKEILISDLDRVTAEIESLALGYKLIHSLIGEDDSHLTLFNINSEEWSIVGADDLIDDVENSEIIHVKSRYILKNFIKRTGPLLSVSEVLGRLGISLENDAKVVQPLLEELISDGIAYTGIFSKGWERYWSYKFEDWCFQVFESQRLSITACEKVSGCMR